MKVDTVLKLAEAFEKLAAGGGFYVVFHSGDTAIFHGPFVDEESAKKASYFAQPVETSDKHIFSLFPFRAYYYDDNEIEAIKNEPESMGGGEWSKAVFKSPHLPIHPTWKALLEEIPTDKWWEYKNTGDIRVLS